jgi:hypothetical protein
MLCHDSRGITVSSFRMKRFKLTLKGWSMRQILLYSIYIVRLILLGARGSFA